MVTALHCNDKKLIEKSSVHCHCLRCRSKQKPSDFQGTFSMLTIGRSVHRLFIDIDVIYPPGANIEIRLSEKSIDFGFIELELVKCKQRNDANILKSHSKFFYKIAYRNDTDPQSFILQLNYFPKNNIFCANGKRIFLMTDLE